MVAVTRSAVGDAPPLLLRPRGRAALCVLVHVDALPPKQGHVLLGDERCAALLLVNFLTGPLLFSSSLFFLLQYIGTLCKREY